MIQKNSVIWSQLEKACETPAQFIRAAMSLRHENVATLAKKLQTSKAYVGTLRSESYEPPSLAACYKIANALNLDPYILNKVCQDYKMKKYIEKENNKNHV